MKKNKIAGKKALQKVKPRAKTLIRRSKIKAIRPKARGSQGWRSIKKPSLPAAVIEQTGAYETVVESSKYLPSAAKRTFRELPGELPRQYGQDKITLVVRDPRWAYAYWEITPNTFDKVRKQLGEGFNRAKMALRVYDVTNIDFTGSNAHGAFDISINEHAGSGYIETGGPGKSFCVDIGYLLPGGRFVTIVRSNAVQTPIEGPSRMTDEEWMVPEEAFGRLYGMGFGLGRTSPAGHGWQEKIRHLLFSGIPGSGGIASMASPVKKTPKEKKS